LYLFNGFWWHPVALLTAAIYWFSVASEIPVPVKQDVEAYGLYGDSFGRLTSLFTALGFGGLIITLIMQQGQIRTQEKVAKQTREKQEKQSYEEILFRLLDIYRQTLSEVLVGESSGREVLRKALDRVDAAVVEDRVNGMPRDLLGRWNSGSLTESDQARIDYLHFRNFKIVGTEINPQARLVDTFEVLLDHMVSGAPDHFLINTYKELVFAQITFLECRYFFLVALSHPSRARLRDLLARTGFFDRISISQIHKIHREMYRNYWGHVIEQRQTPASIPMSKGRIKRALRAHKAAGGVPKITYTPLGVRQSQKTNVKSATDSPE
jgi:predicted CopG family antitoxin